MSTSSTSDAKNENSQIDDSDDTPKVKSNIGKRQAVLNIARTIVQKGPISTAAAAVRKPQAIGAILRDAAEGALELSTNESEFASKSELGNMNGNISPNTFEQLKDNTANAFYVAERAVEDAQEQLDMMKKSLQKAKTEAFTAIEQAEVQMEEMKKENQRISALTDTSLSSVVGSNKLLQEEEAKSFPELDDLSYEDVDYQMSEMAPPFIGEDMCLVPGVPLVRVERAPENSRRIFAGIDIMASVDDVWNVLTDYENLKDVIPNIVTNTILDLYDGDPDTHTSDFVEDPVIPAEEQCKNLANKLKGAKLQQVGGAKIVGINFSARTTLEVREWPEGMPDFAHFDEEMYCEKTRDERIRDSKTIALTKYKFPRPFSISKLPSKAISMQSVFNDDGDFRIYQGVWRMQPLPGCADPSVGAMRLTYAVEISPRAYMPVRLVEGRLAQDLCTNLEAIRDFVTTA